MTSLGTPSARLKHRLRDAELAAVCAGEVTPAVLATLSAAQSSKHRLLVEGVRRRAEAWRPNVGDLLDAALRVLDEVEARSPLAVAGVLELPQTGGWAADCLRTMRNRRDCSPGAGPASSLRCDLGYIAGLTVAAALRAGYPFDMLVPLRGGVLILPSLGTMRRDGAASLDVARVRFDGSAVEVVFGNNAVALPIGRQDEPGQLDGWHPIPHVRAEADGLVLDVMVDGVDPFLHHVGAALVGPLDLVSWQRTVTDAWQLLARHHPAEASALAAGLSVLVPLKKLADGKPQSATSGWTFGAVGLSLPEDHLSLAETLVHELRHLVLGAVEDLLPLVSGDGDHQLSYAPWRDDPRPVDGLLHGCYAYLGVTEFWRKQCGIGTRHERFRSAAAFARWRTATLQAARKLADSPALTEAGRRVAAGINNKLVRWQDEPVWAKAQRLGDEARTEHLVRWRLNYLRPADDDIETFALAWLSGSPASHSAIEIATTIQDTDSGIGPARGHLLEARYTGLARSRPSVRDEHTVWSGEITKPIDDADVSLLRDDDAAVAGYLRHLECTDDISAWLGLAVALRRSGPPAAAQLLAERPEVVAALYARLRAIVGKGPDPVRLLEWLAPRIVSARPRQDAGPSDAR